MTRRVVGYEGNKTIDGRILLPGSLTPKDGPTPVLMYKDRVSGPSVIGKATDFHRKIETGELSFDISTQDELSEELNMHLQLSELVARVDKDEGIIIESAVIHSLFVSKGFQAWTKKEE